jgi:hypothetical protein
MWRQALTFFRENKREVRFIEEAFWKVLVKSESADYKLNSDKQISIKRETVSTVKN